jgi:hypothetical protein
VVHGLPSLQSAAVAQRVQPAIGVWTQPSWRSQESMVHGSPSPQSGGGPGWQPACPPQISAPLHGLPSLHCAAVSSSVCPSQSLSRPSQTSGAVESSTVTLAVALAAGAFTAAARAVVTNVPAPQGGRTSTASPTVKLAPGGRRGTRTSSPGPGATDVTLGSSEEK